MARQQAAGSRQQALVFAEPEERDDPLNAVLDLVENTIRTALDLGLSPQIRARIARFEELKSEAAGSRQQAAGDDALLLANAVSLVAEHGKRARTRPVRERHAAVAAGLNALMKNCCLPAKAGMPEPCCPSKDAT